MPLGLTVVEVGVWAKCHWCSNGEWGGYGAVIDRLRVLMVLGLVVSALVVGGDLAPGALAVGDANMAACPNEALSGFQASLPDCRAYEVVSQANSHDLANITGSYGWPDGEHVYYSSFLPIPGSELREGVAGRFLATRTASGWVDTPVSPPQGEAPPILSLGTQTNVEPVVFSSDFSQAFVNSPFRNLQESPVVDEADGVSVQRLSLLSPEVETVSLPDSGVITQQMVETPNCVASGGSGGCGMFLGGVSADGSKVFFQTEVPLATVPGTPQPVSDKVHEIYERSEGHTYMAGVMPDGSVPACGVEFAVPPGSTNRAAGHLPGIVAPSGANFVFTASTCTESGLFLRDVLNGTTVPLPGTAFNARAGTGPGEEEKLITWGANKLYEYHVATGVTVEIGPDPGNTDEQTHIADGDVLAYTPDGSYVWFLGLEDGIYRWHEGEGEPMPVPGTQAGGYTQKGFGGTRETPGYGQNIANMPVSTADGAHLLFLDSTSLVPTFDSKGDLEAYVYDDTSGEVTCISCNPAGQPEQTDEDGKGVLLIDTSQISISEERYVTPSPPLISEDGNRAVFETTEALVPQDVNGTEDVYEWSRVNTHGCTAGSANYAAVDDGCLYLLSSGLGKEVPNGQQITDGMHLVGASEELKDVYMQSGEALLPGLDNGVHVYDARIDGGFAHSPSSQSCEAGQCELPAGSVAALGRAETEGFMGPGNKQAIAHGHSSRQVASARKRRLTRALTLCRRRRRGRRRVTCERAARRAYGARASRVTSGREGRGQR